MILIERSFCWTDLRKIGIIYSFINIFLDAGVIFLAMHVFGNPFQVAVCFAGPYILLNLMLIYAFYKRKPTILSWWLAFAPFRIITMQTIVIYIDTMVIFYLNADTWISLLLLLGHLVLTTFMFHNVCVVFSVRHRLINKQNEQNRDFINPHVNTIGVATKLEPPYITLKT